MPCKIIFLAIQTHTIINDVSLLWYRLLIPTLIWQNKLRSKLKWSFQVHYRNSTTSMFRGISLIIVDSWSNYRFNGLHYYYLCMQSHILAEDGHIAWANFQIDTKIRFNSMFKSMLIYSANLMIKLLYALTVPCFFNHNRILMNTIALNNNNNNNTLKSLLYPDVIWR